MNRWLVLASAGWFAVNGVTAPVAKQTTLQGEELARQICFLISADDRREFQALINRSNLRLNNLFNSVRCNGYTLLQFAVTAEAVEVGSLLARSLPSRMIMEPDHNGRTIFQWAETTSYDSSQIIQALRQRLPSI